MQNVERTIISQYSNSPTIRALIAQWNDAIDPSAWIDSFYNNIWNVDTAQGIGLDIWGRIVGVGRILQIASAKFFGFDEATTLSADPFNQSPFYGGQQITSAYILSDSGYRTLIYAKALANISDNSVPSINRILMTLFSGRGNAYVIDNLDMTMAYAFSFTPTPVETSIIQQSGVLPRPSGVQATMVLV